MVRLRWEERNERSGGEGGLGLAKEEMLASAVGFGEEEDVESPPSVPAPAPAMAGAVVVCGGAASGKNGKKGAGGGGGGSGSEGALSRGNSGSCSALRPPYRW